MVEARQPRGMGRQAVHLPRERLEHPLVAEDVERCQPDGRGQRVAAVGMAVKKGSLLGVRAEEGIPDAAVGDGGRHRQIAGSQPLGEAEEVGGHLLLLAGEQRAGPAEADRHLVENQEHVVPAGQFADAPEIALRVDDHSPGHLNDRLHHHRRDLAAVGDEHPLEDWDAFEDFEMPDPERQKPLGAVDWDAERERMARLKEQGKLRMAGTEHGFLFLRLYYLRGFENLMMDMATGEPRLQKLTDMIVDYTLYQVEQYLEMDIDVFGLAEDLGAQDRSVMGPRMFEKWIAPAYRRLIEPCERAGVQVHNHSDGYVMDIIDQLLEVGMTICNIQDLRN